MSKKKTKNELNYDKPIYINSFNADEIIFNMIRGTHVKAVKYDGSLPVSLDSLKIKELCDKKKDFKKAFYEKGTINHKTFCDAVINVCFSDTQDFTDVDIIREDVKDETINGSVMEPMGLKDKYSKFLTEFRKNLEKFRKNEESTKKPRDVKPDNLLLWQSSVAVDEISISTNGTRIKVKTTLINKSDKEISVPVLLYLCQENPDEAEKYDVLGTYESEEVILEPGASKTIKSDLDIRNIMELEDDESGYIIEKGTYRLLVGDENDGYPAASIELPETITNRVKHENPGWSYEGDWSFTGIEKDSQKPLVLDTSLQTSFKECGRLYSDILEAGCWKLISKIPGGSIDDKSGDPLKMRYILYANGFDFEDKDGTVRHYVVYKRSASKSKTGSCLFIWNELLKEMMDWTWMGRYFDDSDPEKKYDLTSIKAYEALTLSNIERKFRLKPNNILLINDAEGKAVEGNRRIACVEKDEKGFYHLQIKSIKDCTKCKTNKDCRKKMTEYKNDIWDGQALLDESVFKELYGEEKHGMMLLRNHFFKACAFNTKITEYFKDDNNNIKYVYDMFGKKHKAEDIKLIITPDSLKYLKFAGDLFGKEGKNCKEAAYKYWKNNLKKNGFFGVVKTDKPSNKNGRHKVGYQILNTLPLSGDDMEKLFKPEKKYIEELWKNDEEFMKIIPKESAKGKFIFRMYDTLVKPEAKKGFLKTDDYLSYKRQLINDIKKRMRHGAIELEGEMLTLCSMPYEMLVYSGLTPSKREKHVIVPRLGKNEAFIDGLDNGKPITLCRYPHLSSGSVCSLKNKVCDEYTRWFNLKNTDNSSGIVVISPYESNIMVKLGGADFDSDTALYLKEPVIVEAAEKLTQGGGIMEKLCDTFSPEADGLPVAQASEVLKGGDNKLSLSAYDQAKLDRDLSQTQKNIGAISNDIQLFNSYLWEGLFSDKRDAGYCQAVYECILKLSVLNELEIDRSKHSIDLPLKVFHKEIMVANYNNEPILSTYKFDKKIKTAKTKRQLNAYYQPEFLYEIKKNRGAVNIVSRKDKYWNCPPDHLSKRAAGLRKPRELYDKKRIEFRYITVQGKANQKQVDAIKELIKDAVVKLDKLDRRRHKTGDESDERRMIQTELADKIADMKSIRAKNIAAVVRDAMCKDKNDEYYDGFFYHNKYRILGLLFMVEERIDEKNELNGTAENPVSEVFQKFDIV